MRFQNFLLCLFRQTSRAKSKQWLIGNPDTVERYQGEYMKYHLGLWGIIQFELSQYMYPLMHL